MRDFFFERDVLLIIGVPCRKRREPVCLSQHELSGTEYSVVLFDKLLPINLQVPFRVLGIVTLRSPRFGVQCGRHPDSLLPVAAKCSSTPHRGELVTPCPHFYSLCRTFLSACHGFARFQSRYDIPLAIILQSCRLQSSNEGRDRLVQFSRRSILGWGAEFLVLGFSLVLLIIQVEHSFV